MHSSRPIHYRFFFVVFLLHLAYGLPAHAADMKPEELVAKHLESIGTAEARAACKSRLVQGKAQFKIMVGGAGVLDGKAALVSQGRQLHMQLKFANNDYRGEELISDGNKASVATTTNSQRRSVFGEFVHTQDIVLREGLLSGVLSVAWPLLDIASQKPKLSYEGLKKVDGRNLHALHYWPKRGTDLGIYLYFDPETFRHVMTKYSIAVTPNLARNPNNTLSDAGADVTLSSQQKEIRYQIEERFSEFKTQDGLTLPSHYNIQYTQELQNGNTLLHQWDIAVEQATNNLSLDPRNFQVK